MLNYRTIYEVEHIRRRMKRGYHSGMPHTPDSDRLVLFTHQEQALRESQSNLDQLLAVAREHGQDLVVLKHYTLQVAGRGGASEQVATKLFPRAWLEDHSKWLDSYDTISPTKDRTQQGTMIGLYSYRSCLCLNEHQGVYDAQTGQRLTNRRDIIERMWNLGFAANRGRPLAMARPRWTGTREELESITDLADRYWNRRHESEAAKKMVSAYTSINRYAAWPGAW